MAIITCPSCSKQISDKALACPHCGYNLTNANHQDNGVMRQKDSNRNSSLNLMIVGSILLIITGLSCLYINNADPHRELFPAFIYNLIPIFGLPAFPLILLALINSVHIIRLKPILFIGWSCIVIRSLVYFATCLTGIFLSSYNFLDDSFNAVFNGHETLKNIWSFFMFNPISNEISLCINLILAIIISFCMRKTTLIYPIILLCINFLILILIISESVISSESLLGIYFKYIDPCTSIIVGTLFLIFSKNSFLKLRNIHKCTEVNIAKLA